MAQQRRRPLAEPHQPLPGPGEPRRAPLARAPAVEGPPPPVPHQRHAGQTHRQRREDMAPDAAAGEELQLDPATIVLSLPVAISLGQMIIDQSLDALPQAALWAGAVALWRAASAPGVGRGSLDWLVDSINLDPHLRARLGVPERLPRVAPPPRTRGAWGFVDGLAADVRNLQAAIQGRRGEVVGVAEPGQHRQPITGRTIHLGSLHDAGLDVAAVEALDDSDAGDVPDISLPVVTPEQIANLDNLWVVGPKNSGKTTLLRRLIALRRGKHWALDPHATPGKWPGCVVVGGGLEFAEIDRQLHQFLAWMRQRYKGQATGEVSEEQCKAARRTMVGDEWRAIRKALPEVRATRDTPAIPSAADRLLDILSQGRKAGICALVASHADTAESMGVSGEKDILRCFDLVIYLGALATQHVPAAARMERPAVVYDPERDAWAQLVLTLPDERQNPAAAPGALAPEPAPALAATPPAPTLIWPAPPVRTTTEPAAATPATVVVAAVAPDITTSERTRTAPTTGRAARDTRGDDPAAGAAPAPGAASSVSYDLLHTLLAQPVSAAAGRQDTPSSVAVSAPHAPDTDTGGPPMSSATVTVDTAGHGGVTVNVHATAASSPGRAFSRGRRGLDMRRRRRRAQEVRQADERQRRAARYAEKKLAGWSYRRAYAEIGGNSDEARAAWRAAPGPEMKQPA